MPKYNAKADEARKLKEGIIGPLGGGFAAVGRMATKGAAALRNNPKPGVKTPVRQPEKVKPLYPETPLQGVRRGIAGAGARVAKLAAGGFPGQAVRDIRGVVAKRETRGAGISIPKTKNPFALKTSAQPGGPSFGLKTEMQQVGTLKKLKTKKPW